MVFSLFSAASALALLSVVSAQTYPANTNTACGTASDVNYQDTYYYSSTDLMDWGLYTQSQGTCDTGSYARVHMTDPYGNDIDCGYVALDGKLNLLSCANYPRAYMPEGTYTLYWETVPGVNQYSWNQFTVTHTQSTTTAAVPTSTVTTTPVTVVTTTVVTTSTDTSYLPQVTVTSPSATKVNTVVITPAATTITTTSINYYSIPINKYAYATVTSYITAACYTEKITSDYTAKRASGKTSNKTTVTKMTLFDWLARLGALRRRDDQPNTVGMPGPPRTTTITPDAVITTTTAPTSTSTVTSVSAASNVVVTVTNPTPTTTMLSGVAVQTVTTTLPQSTKSVIKTKLSVTYVTNTVTINFTKYSITTPICTPTPK